MAYIDIPSDIQFFPNTVYPAFLTTLDVTDFGLATAGDVSNVVVVLNVYNTATANSWDYEACLINNDQVITANIASSVFHSNSTTSERVFIFNANTFSKHEIESQSFGFRYRPLADGAVRVYVGNVRVRINNSQPANGITSYITHQAASDDVGVSITENIHASLTKNAIQGLSVIKQSFISKIINHVASVITSATANLIVSVQELLLECSVGIQNTARKSISLLKGFEGKVAASLRKDISAIHGSNVEAKNSSQKFLSMAKSLFASISTDSQKSISLNFNNAVKSVLSIASEIISGLHELVLSCSVGVKENLHKYAYKSLNPIVGISEGIHKHMSIVNELIAEVKSTIQKSIDVIKDTKAAIQNSIEKAVSIIQESWLSTSTSIHNALNSLTEWFRIPLNRINAIFKKDKVETISKNTLETINKRQKT